MPVSSALTCSVLIQPLRHSPLLLLGFTEYLAPISFFNPPGLSPQLSLLPSSLIQQFSYLPPASAASSSNTEHFSSACYQNHPWLFRRGARKSCSAAVTILWPCLVQTESLMSFTVKTSKRSRLTICKQTIFRES